MIKDTADEVISKMNDVAMMYHRLVLLVGQPGSGKTRVLKEVERLTGAPRVNVSLELSKRLLNLTQKERSLRAAAVFEDMLSELRREDGRSLGSVLLDNIEGLFDVSLALDVYKRQDLKAIYTASTESDGRQALETFAEKWGSRYPYISRSWEANWAELSTFFKYTPEIRKLIYTTNPIESFNRALRKVTKTRSVFPNKDALMKLMYPVSYTHLVPLNERP